MEPLYSDDNNKEIIIVKRSILTTSRLSDKNMIHCVSHPDANKLNLDIAICFYDSVKNCVCTAAVSSH